MISPDIVYAVLTRLVMRVLKYHPRDYRPSTKFSELKSQYTNENYHLDLGSEG